ncbi:MAG: response regulator transcription factor [Oscillospiraceae bacterium]|jgi:DNA-binding response OmpR family regulator|nr:response regulator transcription factor [Oscillospiraceae bacterium]
MRILIVEDEQALANALTQIFIKQKYNVDTCYDGESGYDYALSDIYDVIILDIMLPKMNGFDILKELRKNKIKTPVLLLTARDEVSDKVKGLDLGADDYLPKPFFTEELLARVRALHRRNTDIVVDDNCLHYGNLSLNLNSYDLIFEENTVKLGLKEFSIMDLLLRNPTNIISKETLIEKIWGYDSDAEYNNVEVYISFLRKKLDHIKSSVNIITVRGVGYRLELL